MNTNEEVVFYLNKRKIFWRVLMQTSMIFLYGMLFKVQVDNPQYKSFLLMALLVVMIVWTASALIFALEMLFRKSPGLVINSTGIIDKTTGVSAGEIAWDNITRVCVTEQRHISFLTIDVYNFKQYLKRGNLLSRAFKRVNYTLFHSPIHISSHALDVSFFEMVEIVERYYRKYSNENNHF